MNPEIPPQPLWQHPDPEVRRRAVEEMASAGPSAEAVRALLHLAAQDPHPQVRQQALEVLRRAEWTGWWRLARPPASVRGWLKRVLPQWVEEGLLTAAQAEVLRLRYLEARPAAPSPQAQTEPSEPPRQEWGLRIALGLGVFLLLAAALLFSSLFPSVRIPILALADGVLALGAWALYRPLKTGSLVLYVLAMLLFQVVASVVAEALPQGGFWFLGSASLLWSGLWALGVAWYASRLAVVGVGLGAVLAAGHWATGLGASPGLIWTLTAGALFALALHQAPRRAALAPWWWALPHLTLLLGLASTFEEPPPALAWGGRDARVALALAVACGVYLASARWAPGGRLWLWPATLTGWGAAVLVPSLFHWGVRPTVLWDLALAGGLAALRWLQPQGTWPLWVALTAAWGLGWAQAPSAGWFAAAGLWGVGLYLGDYWRSGQGGSSTLALLAASGTYFALWHLPPLRGLAWPVPWQAALWMSALSVAWIVAHRTRRPLAWQAPLGVAVAFLGVALTFGTGLSAGLNPPEPWGLSWMSAAGLYAWLGGLALALGFALSHPLGGALSVFYAEAAVASFLAAWQGYRLATWPLILLGVPTLAYAAALLWEPQRPRAAHWLEGAALGTALLAGASFPWACNGWAVLALAGVAVLWGATAFRLTLWAAFPAVAALWGAYALSLSLFHIRQPQFYTVAAALLGLGLHLLFHRARRPVVALLLGTASQLILFTTTYVQLITQEGRAGLYFTLLFLQSLGILGYGLAVQSRIFLWGPLAAITLAVTTVVLGALGGLGVLMLICITGTGLLVGGFLLLWRRTRSPQGAASPPEAEAGTSEEGTAP